MKYNKVNDTKMQWNLINEYEALKRDIIRDGIVNLYMNWLNVFCPFDEQIGDANTPSSSEIKEKNVMSCKFKSDNDQKLHTTQKDSKVKRREHPINKDRHTQN